MNNTYIVCIALTQNKIYFSTKYCIVFEYHCNKSYYKTIIVGGVVTIRIQFKLTKVFSV